MSGTVTCTSCGREVAKGDRFCPGCGATVVDPTDTASGAETAELGTNPTQCAKCGAAMGRDDRFCPKCGAARPEDATVVSHVSLRNSQAAHLIDATRGEFEVLRELGNGAMGAVYLAKDTALSRMVAIKVIAPNLLSDDTMISRFRLEAQTVASLRHPNIVNVHAVKQSDDLHYFVMEFIDGPTLRDIIKSHAPLEIDVVQGLLFQIGSALNYAHRRGGGVIHRDIKPANIMVDREGDAFVTDFGISKITEQKSGLTQTGATIGTPEYMSPEQCHGEVLTGASDQYALGIVAYEMLIGHTPFTGSHYQIMVSHTSEPPKPILEERPDCPPEVAHAVERMLAKRPEERWPDLDQAVRALGGAPLGYQDPTRNKIVALTGSTVTQMMAVPSTSPSGTGTATKVSVTGLPSLVEAGDRFTLRADIQDSRGMSMSGLGVQWASTDPSIARVTGGVVEALAPGQVSITATAGAVANSVLLQIVDPQPAQLMVRPSSVTVQQGGRIALTAEVRSRQGKALSRAVTWSSSDESIVTVSPQGEVVAVGTGLVTVFAQCEGVRGQAEVTAEAALGAGAPGVSPAATVVAPRPGTPQPSPAVAPAPEAAPAPAPPEAAPAPARAKPVPPKPNYDTPKRPAYRHPAALVALLVLLAGGGYGVWALVGGGAGGGSVSAAGSTPRPASSETALPPGSGSSDPGLAAATPAAGGAGDDGTTDGGATRAEPAAAEPAPPAQDVARSEPPTRNEPATADAVQATPPPEPVRQQTATTPQATPTRTEPEPAAATPPPAPVPGRLSITLASSTMDMGGQQRARARVTSTAGATMAAGDYTLSWRSSNPGVLTVSPEGDVRAAGTGTAWLVASAGSARDSVSVSVAAVVAGVDIAGGDVSLEEGASRALSVVVTGSDDRPMQGQTVAWSSSDVSVATVSPDGEVRAVAEGVARVTASLGAFSGAVEVTVEAAAPVLPSAAAAQSAVEAFVRALSGGNTGALAPFWSPQDGNGLSDVQDLMGERDFSARVGQAPTPQLSGDVVTVTFRVDTEYRTRVGSGRERSLDLSGVLEPAGSDWRLTSVVLR